MADFELRAYQREALRVLRDYLRGGQTLGEELAFYNATRVPYTPAPFVAPETPYICLRIPTGGGKTVVAAHAVGVAAREHLQADNPMVLWLVPSTAILDQTLGALAIWGTPTVERSRRISAAISLFCPCPRRWRYRGPMRPAELA